MIQPLKWWGGKKYLAKRIIDLMPRHLQYVEPFFGGGAVLLAKDPLDPRHQWGIESYQQGTSEVVNDINLELMNFWKVLQGNYSFFEFKRLVEATPFSVYEWWEAKLTQISGKMPDIAAAVGFFVRCRQSHIGQCKNFALISHSRTRRKMNEQVSAWWNCIDGLSVVYHRLKKVLILNDTALNVIRKNDKPETLFYLDPPYLPSTRASKGNYKYEMTYRDHCELLKMIKDVKCSVMISSYPSTLYNSKLSDWQRHEFIIDNKAACSTHKRKMTEVVWTNY